MATGLKAGLYQNAQSVSYLPPTQEKIHNPILHIFIKKGPKMATGLKAGLYQNAQSTFYLPWTLGVIHKP